MNPRFTRATVGVPAQRPAPTTIPPSRGEGLLGVGRVVEDAPGVDEVEAAVGEGELLGVGDIHRPVEPLAREPSTREQCGALGQIHADRQSARSSPLEEVRPRADADLEDALAAPARKLREAEDQASVQPVARRLGVAKERRVVCGVVAARAARFGLPVRLHGLL